MIQAPSRQDARLTRRDKRATWCSFIAVTGVLYFIMAVVMLHLLRPDLNPITHAVSNYAAGSFGFLMISAFFMLALSEFALAWGLARSLAPRGRAVAGVALLNIAGIGLVVTGLFQSEVNVPRPPASASAVVHWTGAGVSFLSLMIAIFLLSGSFKKDARWRSICRLSFAWLAVIVLALAAYGALSIIDWTGAGERLYIAACVLWLLLASLWLRISAI